MSSPMIPCPIQYNDIPAGGQLAIIQVAQGTAPTSNQNQQQPGTFWLNQQPQGDGNIYYLAGYVNGVPQWTLLGASAAVTSVNGSNGVTASPTTGAVVVSGVFATTSTVGVASFNSLDFTVSGTGQVSLIGTTPNSYVNVTGPTTYTVGATDYFISVDCSLGSVTIVLPASTSLNRQFIIKDRLGQAAVNNITLTAGGVTTIDTTINYVLEDPFESAEILFHTGTPNNYEVF